MKKSTKLFLSFGITLGTIVGLGVTSVIVVDPYFHYHAPLTGLFRYSLGNERYVNDGIIRHFDYDAVITGTSMTENFKTSELDNLFGTKSIKVPSSGGTFKEINDMIKKSLNKDTKMVVRGLDLAKFYDDPELMRYDLGNYPSYLYDDNPFNDVNYIFDSKVFFESIPSALKGLVGEKGMVSSFDNYARWHDSYKYGIVASAGGDITNPIKAKEKEMPLDLRNNLIVNIAKNVTDTPKNNPNTTFYYFLTPYSALWWKRLFEKGEFNMRIEAEKYVVEEMLKVPNIKVFAFNDCFDITTNLNFYKDATHYGEWVNSFVLKCMKNDRHMLTSSNYLQYFSNLFSFYSSYDFTKMNDFEDYEDDEYASIFLRQLEQEGRV